MTKRILLPATMATAIACKADHKQTVAGIRDSAGIQIVENPEKLPLDIERWTIEPTPTVEIGAEDQGSDYQLTGWPTALELSTGEVLVIDDRDNQLRLFDSTGKFLWRFGRSGGGPGDFVRIALVSIGRGDSIHIFDADLRRATAISKEGRLGPVVSFTNMNQEWPEVSARLRNGIWIGSIAVDHGDLFGKDPGLWRDSVDLARLDEATRTVDRLGRYPHETMVIASSGGRKKTYQHPVSTRFLVTAGDSWFYAGTQERYEIKAFSGDCRLRRIIRWDRPARSTTPFIPVWTRQALDRVDPKQRANYETEFAALKWPQFLPAHGTIRTDANGNLWVEEFSVLESDSVSRWTVFSSAGKLEAQAELPKKLRVTDLGKDDVVGIVLDSSDVPHVRRYALVKRRPR